MRTLRLEAIYARSSLALLTICALAHEIDGLAATRLFLTCIAPAMLGASEDLLSALSSQLLDDRHIRQIINEGHVRDLNNRFLSTARNLNLPSGDEQWLRSFKFVPELDETPDEIQIVGGLLKWIVSDNNTTYKTRSALAARIAAYLKDVGYTIGTITSWDGKNPSPRMVGSKAVQLVLSGTSPTDPLMLGVQEVSSTSRVLHYQLETVGAMLLSALEYPAPIMPDDLQTQFLTVHDYIKMNLDCRYCASGEVSALMIRFTSTSRNSETSPLLTSLAAVYFPASAAFFGPCYRSIASEEMLNAVRRSGRTIFGAEDVPLAVALFRAITASIVLAFFAVLVASDFERVRHATLLTLDDSEWLDELGLLVDQAFTEGLQYNKAVAALAILHSALEYDEAFKCGTDTIAWRCGGYSVLPSLVLHLRPDAECAQLRLIDEFWANVTPREDGSVRSAITPCLNSDDIARKLVDGASAGTAVALGQGEPYMAPMSYAPPDVPLYLSFERPLHYGAPALSLVGRVHGRPIGSVGIRDVLSTVLRSHERLVEARIRCGVSSTNSVDREQTGTIDTSRICPIHTQVPTQNAIIVPASQWAAGGKAKPVGETDNIFIPVQGDAAWALFLAGESLQFNGQIAMGCLKCTEEGVASTFVEQPGVVIIGYGGS